MNNLLIIGAGAMQVIDPILSVCIFLVITAVIIIYLMIRYMPIKQHYPLGGYGLPPKPKSNGVSDSISPKYVKQGDYVWDAMRLPVINKPRVTAQIMHVEPGFDSLGNLVEYSVVTSGADLTVADAIREQLRGIPAPAWFTPQVKKNCQRRAKSASNYRPTYVPLR